MYNETLENDPYYYITVMDRLFGNNSIYGGTLTTKSGQPITDKFIDKKIDKYDDIDKLEELYNTLLEAENEMDVNYDDNDELNNDRIKLNEYQTKVLEKIDEYKQEDDDDYSIENENDENDLSPEDQQLYDVLHNDLLFLDKKIYEDENYTKNDFEKYLHTLYLLSKLTNNPEYKIGYKNTIDEYEEKYGEYKKHEEYVKDINDNIANTYRYFIKNEIKDINTLRKFNNEEQLRDGILFEDVIMNTKELQGLISKITGDNSNVINNNNTNPKLNKLVDFNGKKKLKSELYIYDLSQNKTDLEIKYFDTRKYMPSDDDIKREGIKLQATKFGNTHFKPLFKYDDDNKFKLYNVIDKETKQYINDDFMKDVYVIYKTLNGIYSYHLNGDNDNYIIQVGIDDSDGKPIYEIRPKYKTKWTDEIDDFGNLKKVPYLFIPYNKLKKIL